MATDFNFVCSIVTHMEMLLQSNITAFKFLTAALYYSLITSNAAALVANDFNKSLCLNASKHRNYPTTINLRFCFTCRY